MRARHVLIGLGYDGAGRPELNWAAAEAHARGSALRVVRAYAPSEPMDWAFPPSWSTSDEVRAAGAQALEEALDHVHTQWPRLEVDGDLVEGPASRLLIDGSCESELTVVGSRQLGTIGAMTLGSVSAPLVAAAHGPVVVVGNHTAEPWVDPVVVVGVDVVAGSSEALGFAFDYAQRRGCTLHAVACWHHRLLAATPRLAAHLGPSTAAGMLEDTLACWQDKYPDVPVRRRVVQGHPVAEIAAASVGQELAVVGGHGRRQHAAGRIGSVSQGVLHHARCPVAVVHPQGGEP